MSLRLLLGGLKSYLPPSFLSYTGTGGSASGTYCYAVWMRHITIINQHVHSFRPQTVVELGPGDSIGLGLAALLGGARRYHGLDILEHAGAETNSAVLDELVALYRRRAPIPDDSVFPNLFPRLRDYAYPAHLIEDSAVNERLAEAYVNRLRFGMDTGSTADPQITYSCPWSARSVSQSSADLVITQVALQDMNHAAARDDLTMNLEIMAGWLRQGGVMSHQVDFSCPSGAPWNHHWAYGSLKWSLIRGRRPYYVNRVPLSEYLRLFEAVGVKVLGVEATTADGLARERLAAPFCDLPESDLRTRGALIVAMKR